MSHRSISIAALLAALPLPGIAFAGTGVIPVQGANQSAASSDAATIAALNERLRRLEARLGTADNTTTEGSNDLATLDQRLLVLERKLELQQEDATAKAATIPIVAVNEKGLSVKSPTGDFELRLRGTIQADQRSFSGDKTVPQNNTFLFRLVRPTLEGSLGPLVGFRLTPDFAGDSATLVDAYVDLRFDPGYTLRVGKFTGPVGLERLQSSSSTATIERGYPTELAPNRELGVQLQGDLAAGRASYAIGVFNGAPDGRDAPTTDADNNVEIEGRVFFEPWKNSANALSGLGFGIAASTGDKQGTGNNFLPRYRTPGQVQFFNYRSTVVADGRHTRFSPQAYFYRNAFGLLGEVITSEQEVLVGTNQLTRIELENRAWQLTGSWVLTGEDASYRGVVKPAHSFVSGGEGWGAFELVARVGELDIDDDAFPRYADPSAAASQSRSWGIGLNWYLTPNLKLVFNHTHASFDGGAPNGQDREDEKAFFSRLQVAF